MFGEYDEDKAHHIAKLKSEQLGVKCIVVPGLVDPKKFTIAVPVTATTPLELLEALKLLKIN